MTNFTNLGVHLYLNYVTYYAIIWLDNTHQTLWSIKLYLQRQTFLHKCLYVHVSCLFCRWLFEDIRSIAGVHITEQSAVYSTVKLRCSNISGKL